MLKKENGATETIPVLPERARSECARSMGAVGIIPVTPLDEAGSLRSRLGQGASRRAGVGWVRTSAFLSIM